MAATAEKKKILATIDYTLQSGRHEEVVGLEQLVVTLLDRFARAHAGRLSPRLIIYRDGVCEVNTACACRAVDSVHWTHKLHRHIH